MAGMHQIPPELVTHLFLYLNGEDLGRISQVSKKLHEASHVDLLWKRLCHLEYGVNTSYLSESWQTYREVYIKVLRQYGFLLGSWIIERSYYGGLLNVVFDGGTIIGVEYQEPKIPVIKDNLRFLHQHFTTVRTEDGSVELRGCNKIKSNCCEAHLLKKVSGNGIDMVTLEKEKTCQDDKFQVTPWLHDMFFITNFEQHEEYLQNYELAMRKIQTIQKLSRRETFTLHRFTIPSVPWENVLIQPGLFIGEYSAHGYEILRLEYMYVEDCSTIHVIKITGDPNIPSGEVSVKVDLSRPMVLTLGQQDFMQNLTDGDIPDVLCPDQDLTKLPPQPFKLPSGCSRFFDDWEHLSDSSTEISLPKKCKARFHCKGHVAAHGFKDDQYLNGHFIIFSEDMFAILWLPFHRISLYIRAVIPSLSYCEGAAATAPSLLS